MQAVVKGTFQFLMWVGHMQVLFFFLVCDPKTDPLYSHEVYTTMMEGIGEAAWDIPTVIVDHPFMRDEDAGRLALAPRAKTCDQQTTWESIRRSNDTDHSASPALAEVGNPVAQSAFMAPTVVGAAGHSPARVQ
eukprot:2113567-Amphidinium_carterae.1